MKKFLSLILALVMACSLIACGGSKEEAPAKTEAPKTEAPAKTESKTEAPAESAFDKEYKWSLATTYATGSVVVQMYERFAASTARWMRAATAGTIARASALPSAPETKSRCISTTISISIIAYSSFEIGIKIRNISP